MLDEDIIQMMVAWMIYFIQFLKFNILSSFLFYEKFETTLKVLFTKSQHLLLAREFQRDVQYWSKSTRTIKSIDMIVTKLIVGSKLLLLLGNGIANDDRVDVY
tara:strand:+ start:1167 stop:1475 length:309 start_codon:yes stop_codon:yes gene_type:complete